MQVEAFQRARHVAHVIRSRHYTWLPEGLAGQPVDTAMTRLTADVMHVCRQAGIPWETVLRDAMEQFDIEDSEEPVLVTMAD